MSISREEYLKCKKKLIELSDRKAEFIISGINADNEEYQNIQKRYDEINNLVVNYEKDLFNDICNRNLKKDVQTCLEMLEPLDDYSIGKHSCGMYGTMLCEPYELADSFLSKGILSAKHGVGGVVGFVHILGNINVEQNLYEMIKSSYVNSISSNKGGVIVAIPTTLLGCDNKRLYLGEFPNDLPFIAKSDARIYNLPINDFVTKNEYLPPEFILGVVSVNEKGEHKFTKNNRFISQLSEEEQIDFCNYLISKGLNVEEVSNNYHK